MKKTLRATERAVKRYDEDGDELTDHGYWVAEKADEFAIQLQTRSFDEVYDWWFNQKDHPGTHIADVLVEVNYRGLNPSRKKVEGEKGSRRVLGERSRPSSPSLPVPSTPEPAVPVRTRPQKISDLFSDVTLEDVRQLDLRSRKGE